jgi:hypothetical protein
MRDDMSDMDNETLSDKVKASVISSGVLAKLKNVTQPDMDKQSDNHRHDLKHQVQDAIDDILKKLNSGMLDDSTSLKLSGVLQKLQAALHNSPDTLAAVLSEAATAISSSGSESISVAQKKAQLWQQVETDNKTINDDFEKMHEAGIAFNDTTWNRHKQLMQNLKANPQDLKTQKELDAVDDALLLQAQPQLKQCPDAQASFGDAKVESDDRHKAVDQGLMLIDKKEIANNSVSLSDFDNDTPASGGKLTLNDVTSQSVGQQVKSVGKTQSI